MKRAHCGDCGNGEKERDEIQGGNRDTQVSGIILFIIVNVRLDIGRA